MELGTLLTHLKAPLRRTHGERGCRVAGARRRWGGWSRRLQDRLLAWRLGRVTIIVVSYNALDLIRQCVGSILADASYPRYRLVVVDNASEGPVQTYLRGLHQTERRVQVIFNDTNRGFAAANNIGLRHLDDSAFIVLLNNDTVVPPGWLGRLVRHARRADVGLVGPVTNWTGNEARIEVGYSDVADMPDFAAAYTSAHRGQVFEIKMLAMFCVAMRREVFEQVGPLDERFGQGMFEDEDYARRIKAAGYKVICAEDAFVHHYGRASFSKLPLPEYEALFVRNRRLYEEKWGEPWIPHQWRAPSPGERSEGPENVSRITKCQRFWSALKLYLANHVVAHVPSFRIRHWYYRHVLGYPIGRDSSIHMDVFVTGDAISLGDNVVINRRCYLDGRVGIDIRNNVSISPEVSIVSLEHDPDSPAFATRGGTVVIEDRVWIGTRALISPGVRLGEGAVIGAGAVVTRDINPYRIAVGVPAREIRDRNRALDYACRYFPWFDTDVQR